MSVNKLERLLNLTAVLLNTTRPLSAEEIRRKVEGYPPPGSAFHRAFERDKDDLRVLGVPLRVERVAATDPPTDGYRIDPDEYYLPDPGLEPDELAALHLASLTVRLDGLTDQEAFWKLGGLGFGAAGENEIGEALGAGEMVATIPTDPALVPLFQAISEGRAVSFVYNDQPRQVDPWRLDFQRGRWYLTGHDRIKADKRTYRLDRIVGSVERTGETVATAAPLMADGPLPPWEVGEDAPVEARLLVDSSRVPAARRQLGEKVASELMDDGSVIFTVPVVRYQSFRDFVLGFLHHAELLEPADWRADVVAWLTRLVGEDDVVAEPAGKGDRGE